VRTVTFYSYKGGTGRTLLLANVAMLAARLGYKVVAVDLDLEAPGLGYKLFETAPQESHGVVRWLHQRVSTRKAPAVAPLLLDVPVEDPFRPGGWLRLLPAGRGPSIEYFAALQELALDQHLASGEAADAFLDLQDAIETAVEPDLLLLDARTGVATSNLATTRVLADDVVALTLDTPEQLEGTRAVLRSLAPLTSLRTKQPLGLHVVLSRVEGRPAEVGSYKLNDAEREKAAEVRRVLEEPADPISDTLSIPRVLLLHAEPSLMRGDVLLLRRGDAIEGTALHLDYIRVAKALLGEDVSAIIAAAIAQVADPHRREQTARFFGQVEAIGEARGAQRSSEAPREPRSTPDLAERAVMLRARSRDDPTARPDLAALLLRVAELHDGLGQRRDALDPAEEATRIFRELAAAEPDRYRPDLARALGNLGRRLSELGRAQDALDPAEEATRIFRELAAAEPDRYRPDLAGALTNLGIMLGRAKDAHAAAKEATHIYRQLVAAEPDRYRPHLAGTLTKLGVTLSELGRAQDARAATEEATRIYRQLAAAAPDRYRPHLAKALINLGGRLSELGRGRDAHAAADEATLMFRELYTAEPDRYGPFFAEALNNLGNVLFELGRAQDARSATEESIRKYRQLAATEPDRYRPHLASALVNLGITLSELGRAQWAYVPAEEATCIYRELAAAYPDRYRPHLAGALTNLGITLSESGRTQNAQAAAEEATRIYREVAAVDPLRYRPALAKALTSLGRRLSELGRAHDAAPSAEEATSIFRELAATDPDRYRRRLVNALDLLSECLEALGRVDDAKNAHDEREQLLLDLMRGE